MFKLLSYTLTGVTICLSAALCAGCGSGGDEVSFKSGGMTQTFSEGPGSIPTGFPLPVYPNSTTTGSVSADSSSEPEGSRFLMLASKDPVKQVSQYYVDQLKASGWKVEDPQSSGNLINLSASHGDMDANVMVSAEGGKTTISLSVSKASDGSTTEQDDSGSYEPNKVTPPTD